MNHKKDITYEDRLDELKLDMLHHDNKGITFIIVEGDTDIRLFRKFFSADKCKVEYVPGGKPKVEECVAEFVNDTLIIGILDADFQYLNGINEEKNNIFLTDYHDIEMMMLAEDEVFYAVLSEFGNMSRSECVTLRNKFLKSIEKISYLKWLNDREILKLKFKETDIKNLISLPEFQLDFNEYLLRILAKSDNAVIKDKDLLLRKINELTQLNPALFHLTNGHDVLLVIAKYFREIINIKLSDKNIASIFSIAYTTEYFHQTNLFEALKNWAIQNNTQLFTT